MQMQNSADQYAKYFLMKALSNCPPIHARETNMSTTRAEYKKNNKELMTAIAEGKTDIILKKLELPKININFQDQYGDTPLMSACREGNIEIAKKLIEAKADIHYVNNDRKYGIAEIAYKNQHFDILEMLMQNGSKNCKNIFDSARRNHVSMIVKLSNYGYLSHDEIKILIKNHNGNVLNRILDNAIEKDDKALVKLILSVAWEEKYLSWPYFNYYIKQALEKKHTQIAEILMQTLLAIPFVQYSISYEELIFSNDIDSYHNGKLLGSERSVHLYQAEFKNEKVIFKVTNISSSDHIGFLNEEFKKDSSYSTFFINEVKAMSELQSPHVIKFLGIANNGTVAGIVLKHYNSSLDELLNNSKTPISLEQKLLLAKQISDGLSHIHHKDWLHNNLQASTILLDEKQHPVIADFSTATPVSSNEDLIVDIYSLGLLFLRIATNLKPSVCENKKELYLLKKSGKLETLLKDCPAPWKEIIQYCWNDNPLNPPDAEQISHLLEKALKDLHKPQIQTQTISAPEEMFTLLKIRHDLNLPFPVSLQKYVISHCDLELEKKDSLGRGAIGYVQPAFYKGEEVAIKYFDSFYKNILPENLKPQWENYLNEVSLMIETTSEHITQIRGISFKEMNMVGGKYAIAPAIVMKRCVGNLYEILKDYSKPVEFQYIYMWGKQISQALAEIHAKSWLHRDLRLKNILLDDKGNAILSDFGQAVRNNFKYTRIDPCQIINFYAPELIIKGINARTTEASEVYSLGLILWEILTRNYPFGTSKNLDLIKIKKSLQHEKIPDSCPPGLKKIILACWDNDPEKRPTAQEVANLCAKELSILLAMPVNSQPVMDDKCGTKKKSLGLSFKTRLESSTDYLISPIDLKSWVLSPKTPAYPRFFQPELMPILIAENKKDDSLSVAADESETVKGSNSRSSMNVTNGT